MQTQGEHRLKKEPCEKIDQRSSVKQLPSSYNQSAVHHYVPWEKLAVIAENSSDSGNTWVPVTPYFISILESF